MTTGNLSSGSGTGTSSALKAADLRFQSDKLIVVLEDSREVSVPLRLYPTLAKAPARARSNWQLIGPGKAFHWPDLDLDLSVEGLVQAIPEGTPAPPPPRPSRRAARRR